MKHTVSSTAPRRGVIFWMLLLACSGILSAQPTLTTIQDILYKADGTRFHGTVSIEWKPFVTGTSSFIPQQATRVEVVNGVFRAKLVPTTDASAGANYEVTFASQGRYLFTDTWAVPPSAAPLKVKDVRISSGTVIGTPPVVGQLSQISDIEGLENELLIRPMRGFSFGYGRVATINSGGQIDAVQGNLGDCVLVDGSSAPCGTGSTGSGSGTTVGFVDGEIPTGLVNSSNATFSLVNAPTPASSLQVFRNGLLMRSGLDYNLSGQTISFLAASLPQTGDALLANYRMTTAGGGSGGSGGTTVTNAPEILCSGIGTSTGSATAQDLATCVLDPTVLLNGTRFEVRFGFNHTGGTAVAPRIAVRWGAGDVLSRNLSATETTLLGTVNFTITAPNTVYFTDSRGVVTTQSATSGISSQSLASPVTISLRGYLASASGSESVALRYYSVVRYPAVP
jgi:hypothetical protein